MVEKFRTELEILDTTIDQTREDRDSVHQIHPKKKRKAVITSLPTIA
jgi:hypothetical protein